MKKVVLLSGLLLSSVFMNASVGDVNEDDNIIIRKEVVAHNTQIFKTQILKIQLQQSKSLNQSIRLLKQLKCVVKDIEKSMK